MSDAAEFAAWAGIEGKTIIQTSDQSMIAWELHDYARWLGIAIQGTNGDRVALRLVRSEVVRLRDGLNEALEHLYGKRMSE